MTLWNLLWLFLGSVALVAGIVFGFILSVFHPGTAIWRGSPRVPFALGMTVMIIGMALGTLSTGPRLEAQRNGRFATIGPFAISRHPLYMSAVCFFYPGFGIALNNWVIFAFLLVWGFLMFYPFMRREERGLTERFGDEYRDYARKVGLVFSLGRQKD